MIRPLHLIDQAARRRLGLVAGIAALALTAACGSTVQVRGTGSLGNSGTDGSGLSLPETTTGGNGDSATSGTAGGGSTQSPTTNTPGQGGPVTSTSGTTGTTGSAPVAGTTGATAPSKRVTGPVEVGFLVDGSGGSAATALGANSGNTFSTRSAAESLVAAVNKRGGLAGRQIKPVYYNFDYQGNYSQQYQAACSSFTTDHKAVAVWSIPQIYSQTFESCLAQHSTVHLNGSYASGDATAFSKTPTLISTGAPTVDRRMTAVIKGLSASGYLAKTSKIGVLLESCPENVRAFNRTVKPQLASHSLTLADSVEIDCTSSFGQAGSSASALSSAVLRFRQRGVDRVMIVSNFEAVSVLLFANAAESQGYRPGYALSSAAGPALLGAQLPAGQAANMHGVGWLPAIDVTSPAFGPAAKTCLATFRAAGINPSTATDRLTVLSLCDATSLLDTVLKRTNGASSSGALLSGVNGLGGAFAAAMVLNERTTLSGSQHDGPTQARTWAWNTSCSCSAYAGSPSTF